LSSTNVTRIAAADINGDSPTRRVAGPPKLLSGNPIPIAALVLPPYSRTHSDGRSSVSMGTDSSKGQTKSDGMMYEVRAGLGYSQDFQVFAKIVSAEAEVHWDWQGTSQHDITSTLATSASFEVEAKPELEGYNGGVVMLGCGCYHQYDYKIEDPAGKLGAGADGKVYSIYVPVAAQTSVWSTRRYNALVEALGNQLPKINIPYEIGQVASYPDKPTTLDGQVIAQEDMVFLNPPTFRVSEIAATNFELSVEHEEVQADMKYGTATGAPNGASVQVGVFGFTGSLSLDKWAATGSSLTVSDSSKVSGTIPPVRKDLSTPEDQLKLYGYSFTPLLYRQHYRSVTGTLGSFLVLTYAVGQ
jgi:hypothetical protein